MKKMIAFFILIILLFCISFIKNNNFNCLENYEKIIVVSNQIYDYLDLNPIKNGNEFYHVLTKENADDFLENINLYDYNGISFYYDLESNFDDFNKCINYTLSDPSYIDNYKIYYGFYDEYKDFRIVNGKKINVQLVQTESEWILGFPLILTGF